MGRIVAKVTVANPLDKTKSRTFDALVDTLEQSGILVDMLGHRLKAAKYLDLK